MFELGLRLAFDKATIVIKDDKTTYPFDTSPLQYIEYPRGLHYHQIQQFKKDLSGKIESTYRASQDPGYSTYLKHFVEYKPKKLPTEEVEISEALLSQLAEIRDEVRELRLRTGTLLHAASPIQFRVSGDLENLKRFQQAAWKSNLGIDQMFAVPNNANEIGLISHPSVKRSQIAELRAIAEKNDLQLRIMDAVPIG